MIGAGQPLLQYGLVAQLGERTVRIRKVEGSIPFESTKKKHHPMGGVSFLSTLPTKRSHACFSRQHVLIPRQILTAQTVH